MKNGDGDRGTTEDPIPETRIIIYDENENVVAATSTDENGFYEFTRLRKGELSSARNPNPIRGSMVLIRLERLME